MALRRGDLDALRRAADVADAQEAELMQRPSELLRTDRIAAVLVVACATIVVTMSLLAFLLALSSLAGTGPMLAASASL